MRGRIGANRVTGARTYFLDGKEVTPEEFEAAFPPKELGASSGHSTAWSNGLESDALAVHPKQIEAVMARNKKHGLNVEYLPDGRPKLTDRGQRRDLMRLEGFHDNQGGYGD